ncbi:hypothetical protein DPSP01_000995 [Paraphaeosphaeria sporulosa]
MVMSVGNCYFKGTARCAAAWCSASFRVVFQLGGDQAVLDAAKMNARQGGRVTDSRRRERETNSKRKEENEYLQKKRSDKDCWWARCRPTAMLLRTRPGLCRVRLLVETDLLHSSMFQDAHLSSKPLARVRHRAP